MWYYAIKVLISSILIVIISEVSKRSGLLGGLFASIPLLSFLAILWIYFETHDTEKISALSIDIFWLVLPSLSFFLAFPYLLRKQIAFGWSMLIATVLMLILYAGMLALLKR
ncbi:MAG: hypothetical protein CVU48_01725 [Candidatus Cloacimonetes bacterium HGW-Cloacimonetes-1]|jgi:F0F1-type ATP synthase assembly protein I|nr:MAG: hypothetical protein CVU48_01725 [Candidatus Cloacimonetes bacterium HGW-Cloacimonetes-1]